MSKEIKGKCKYCHLAGHVIDKCPTIICKHCKAIGHPNWLCKSNPNAENIKSPLSPNLRNKKSIYAFDSTNSLSKSQNFDSTNSLSKSQTNINDSLKSKNELEKNNSFKNSLISLKEENNKNEYTGFKEDFKQKVIETKEVEIPIINLQYYKKMIDCKWGDLMENF